MCAHAQVAHQHWYQIGYLNTGLLQFCRSTAFCVHYCLIPVPDLWFWPGLPLTMLVCYLPWPWLVPGLCFCLLLLPDLLHHCCWPWPVTWLFSCLPLMLDLLPTRLVWPYILLIQPATAPPVQYTLILRSGLITRYVTHFRENVPSLVVSL